MFAKDIFHDTVKRALEKEEWTITHDPLPVASGDVGMSIDLGAEKLIAAEKEGQKIAVEIKSFLGKSAIYDFHLAVGQFINYRLALKEIESSRVLYLAVPIETNRDFFSRPFIQTSIAYNEIKLIVYDLDMEVIVEWKN
ncbi:MAG: fatty-acid oxidation protein subunit alpha [Okeania sp. SIO3I5]|uniref:element excision factor XisH family protein n=1 Tax=Okeania sp. SIO3I5 TaxID=2607805 RepID=UPI0013BE11EF|nr:element excision factor XisH family protein [Okeania sp. SIO3I5]NEQ41915.1 fatty-acid oxidation protein subunit alpha [Okeania sp. SIO3I5]